MSDDLNSATEQERESKSEDEFAPSAGRTCIGLLLFFSPFWALIPYAWITQPPMEYAYPAAILAVVVAGIGAFLVAPAIFASYFKKNLQLLRSLGGDVVVTKEYAATEFKGWILFIVRSSAAAFIYFVKPRLINAMPAAKIDVPNFRTIFGQEPVGELFTMYRREGRFSIPTPDGIIETDCTLFAIDTIRQAAKTKEKEITVNHIREIMEALSNKVP